jgi:hypothetical protein
MARTECSGAVEIRFDASPRLTGVKGADSKPAEQRNIAEPVEGLGYGVGGVYLTPGVAIRRARSSIALVCRNV